MIPTRAPENGIGLEALPTRLREGQQGLAGPFSPLSLLTIQVMSHPAGLS